jgi:hypothetical protein
MVLSRRGLFFLARVHFILAALALTLLFLSPRLLETDVKSLTVTLAGVFFLLTGVSVAAAALLLLLLRLVRRLDLVPRLFHSSPFAILFAAAVTIVADPWLVRADRQELLLVVFAAAALFGYIVERRSHARLPQIDGIAMVLLVASVAALPAVKAARALRPAPQHVAVSQSLPPSKRGLVVMVVDGMGAKYISALNPESPIVTPNLDAFIKGSTAFTNAYSNCPYTLGAFTTLYSGRIEASNSDRDHNLLATLQSHGVRTRLVVCHQNALPETKCYHYDGLRTLYLSQNYTALPRWLGLEYNVFVYTPPAGKTVKVPGRRKDRLAAIRTIANAPFPEQGPLRSSLGELEDLAQGGRPFFLLIHLFPHSVQGAAAEIEHASGLSAERTTEERRDAEARIRASDYRYEPGDAWRVEELRQSYLQAILAFDAAFGRFLTELEQRPWAGAIDILLTADHGSMYQDGKVWYGYQVDEPVTQIPLALRTDRAPGSDARLCATVDISATALDWFGIDPQTLSPDAASLLRPAVDRRVLCFSGRLRNGTAEGALYEGGEKQVFQIDANDSAHWQVSERPLGHGDAQRLTTRPADVAGLEATVTAWCRDHKYTR